MANTSQGSYEFMVLQYDGNGTFRVLDATPATAQAIGIVGAAGISHWSYPSVSGYIATGADNGNVISSVNSPLPYLAITLPSTTVLPMGWTIGITTDGNKAASVQVNNTSGGHILYPGSGATITSASLAGVNYELLMLQFDGSNFRVIDVTPATATLIGIIGNAPGINRWSFPAVSTYAASRSNSGNALSSYNTPTSSLTVTLALQFDGNNFRIASITPRSAAALGMLGHQIVTGATPTVGSGSSDCGTSPSIGGNDSAGRVRVGASTNGGRCTITFASPWPNLPVCSVFDETTGNLVRPIATSTNSVVLIGTLAAGDSIVYQCVGYQ
jgi:hypothetical protein